MSPILLDLSLIMFSSPSKGFLNSQSQIFNLHWTVITGLYSDKVAYPPWCRANLTGG